MLIFYPITRILLIDFNLDIENIFFDFGLVVHVASLLLIILHVESSVKGYRATILPYSLLILLAFFFFTILQYFELHLISFQTRQLRFYDVKIKDPLHFSNVLLVKQIASFLLSLLLVYTYSKNIKTSTTIKKKTAYSTWIYGYFVMFSLSALSTSLLYYDLLDPSYDELLIKINQVFIVMNVIYFVLFPSIIYYVPLIKKSDLFYAETESLTFTRLNSLFDEQEVFLETDLSLRSVSLKSGLKENAIRSTIKNNTGLNFNDFVNKHRIEYSIALMNTDFLQRNLITSLGLKSGFKSNQTYYRSFKKLMNETPAVYYKTDVKDKEE